MNINLTPQQQQEERLAVHADIPAATEALKELEVARDIAARAQAKIDAATAVAAQWDQFKRWRAELQAELAALHQHLKEVRVKCDDKRKLVYHRLVSPIRIITEPLTDYMLWEKVLQLGPDVIAAKERELKELHEEMIAFAETHKISARIEDDSRTSPPSPTAAAEAEAAEVREARQDLNADPQDAAGPGQDESPPVEPPPLRGARRRNNS